MACLKFGVSISRVITNFKIWSLQQFCGGESSLFIHRKFNSAHLSQLHFEFFSFDRFPIGDTICRFQTQNIASLSIRDLIVSVVVVGPDVFHQLGQGVSVFHVPLPV